MPDDLSKKSPEKQSADVQTVLDSLPYRVMVVNPDKTIHMVNRTFLEKRNLKTNEVLGKKCYEIRYGLDQPCKESGRPCYMEEVRKTGKFIPTMHETKTPEGESRFDVITVTPIFGPNKEIVQFLETARDVTDTIRLEAKAQRSNIFLQNVIQSTVDGIVVVDTKGYVLIFNEGMEKLTGYSVEEILDGGHLSRFYDMDIARENMRRMRSRNFGPEGKLNPTSMNITAKNGETIPITLTASLITIDGQVVGSVGIFTDMRQVLRMQKELEETHFQLVQSEKIASIGNMAAGIAHEINNPLSGILIYAELLKGSLEGRDQDVQDAQEIIDQTLRCKQIVSELLEFSRQSVGKTSAFGLKQLLNKCLNLLIHQASFQNIKISKDFAPNLPEMVGDMGQLQQVFTNLFVNAADAMKGRGTLAISARYDSERSSFIIKVGDTGPGIPENQREKIFDIFFTTKPVGKGTGLGLSISQNIIKLHGGNISFSCPPEGGTVFIIELPCEFTETSTEEPVFIGMDKI
ncbi:MAG: ATP-binding protein [Desulfatiglandaceae bacterium]|jgi:PAS domain S-box-containing protein